MLRGWGNCEGVGLGKSFSLAGLGLGWPSGLLGRHATQSVTVARGGVWAMTRAISWLFNLVGFFNLVWVYFK